MKQKYIILFSVLGGVFLFLTIFLICFFNIPRITYGYDREADTYYVDTVYGNSSNYTIKDTVEGKPVTKIKSRAFMNKTGLKTLYLGENIVEIERLAFLNCSNLKEIDLSKVEFIGRNAFENCTSLKEVHLTLMDILGGTFMGCSSLTKVTLENTLSIGSYAFGLTAIKELTIPRTCSLVGEDAFYGCKDLKAIYVLSFYLRNNAYLKSLEIVEFQLM